MSNIELKGAPTVPAEVQTHLFSLSLNVAPPLLPYVQRFNPKVHLSTERRLRGVGKQTREEAMMAAMPKFKVRESGECRRFAPHAA